MSGAVNLKTDFLTPIEGGVTAPKGFLASGVRCGLKTQGPDLALIVSDRPAAAAAMFTSNVVKAAPVVVSMKHVSSGWVRAVVANAGNANACTGEQGLRDAEAMARHTAELLRVSPQEVLVASTGVIGRLLPMDKVLKGIEDAVSSLSANGSGDAAKAVMTTDTRPKEYAFEMAIPSSSEASGYRKVRVGGIAKGSGMICPNLATMLCFITTDAPVSPTALGRALKNAVDASFNCLTVDGDGSTNDTVFALANGAAGGPNLEEDGEQYSLFCEGLTELCCLLARELARDGEGATKLVTVVVEGAADDAQARAAAFAVANSNLVKTALFGNDPNWGRVLAAAGRSGAQFSLDETSLYFGQTPVFENGSPVDFNADELRTALSAGEVEILLRLGGGPGRARYYTCDLSYDYVRINAEYHT